LENHQLNTLRIILLIVMIVASSGVAGRASPISQTGLVLVLPESAGEPVKLRGRLPKSDKPIDWETCFAVYVVDADNSSGGPVQGSYRIVEDTLTLHPDFPFSPGVKYRVDVATELVAKDKVQGVRVERFGRTFVGIPFSLPVSSTLAPPKVERVFPTSDELPENILRFYIYFSNPMQRGWASRAISMHDEDGNEVENVFMEFKQELWCPDQKRLTVLLDPGRIKRGVATNVRLGQALQVGRRYKLQIEGAWPDAAGKPLGTNYEKAFRVTSAVRSTVETENWSLISPTADSTAPLKLTLDRPLDHALLGRLLCVRDASDQEVPGRIELGHGEAQWSFFPQHSWKSGDYQLTVQPELEDLAGNNLRGPLDKHLGDERKVEQKVKLAFVVTRAKN
jgi:hypothetical protein